MKTDWLDEQGYPKQPRVHIQPPTGGPYDDDPEPVYTAFEDDTDEDEAENEAYARMLHIKPKVAR